MKLFLISMGLVCISPPAFADVAVKGYTRSNGTYVTPHMRSDPNSTKADNFSTRGNTNPYTGEPGTKDCGSDCVGASTTSSSNDKNSEIEDAEAQKMARTTAVLAGMFWGGVLGSSAALITYPSVMALSSNTDPYYDAMGLSVLTGLSSALAFGTCAGLTTYDNMMPANKLY